MAVPTIVNMGTAATNTITKPSGGGSGDFYVVMTGGSRGDHAPDTSITGFTSVTKGTIGTTSFDILYRLYTGSEGASFTTTEGYGAGEIFAFIVRGADPAQTPLSNAISVQTPSAASIAVTGITTSVANTLGLLGWACLGGGSSDTPTASGWTLDTSLNRQREFSQDIASPGATGTVTVTDAFSNREMLAGLLGFAPTAGGGGNDPDVPLLDQIHTYNVYRM